MTLLALGRAGYDADGSWLLAYERERHFAVLEHADMLKALSRKG